VSRCGDTYCTECGWNENVNRQRRAEIHRLSAEGRLTDWGKPISADTVDRILELKAELEGLLQDYQKGKV